MNLAPNAQERLRFFEHNAAEIFRALRQVSPQTHVGFVCDMRDPVARRLTMAIIEKEGKIGHYGFHAQKVARDNQIQTGIFVLGKDLAVKVMAESSPNLSKALDMQTPKSGRAFIIVISEGASMLLNPELPS